MKEKMKILKLTLKKQWFDMIASGVKTEEYREIKDYWINRFVVNKEDLPCSIENAKLANYDAVEFTNGYGKHRPQITLECLGIEIGQGNCKWGAPLEDVFIIKLGNRIE